MAAMIEISGLSKIYGDKRALDNVSFHAESGKVTALIGPNGAGKSTLLGAIAVFVGGGSWLSC
ncbi:ATP-binding cassette domain-containing protein [Bifidobacterium reuteri]|uniref:ATP-binding cassette domain-containing protein n=1 Tax=Bifidobacterium reuteri TaxID=983706 RepID=UPI001CC2ACF9|nr:ATP-binding cassette domain-containing protein [Bifidobacterium reuteri]